MEKKNLDTLAARVDYLINKQGFTSVSQAAKACAVPQPRLNDIVRGKTLNPRAETIQKIAYKLDTTVEWLLEKSGPMRTGGAKTYESRGDDHPQIAQPPPGQITSLSANEQTLLGFYRQMTDDGHRELIIAAATIVDREKRKGGEGGQQAHKTAL